MKGDAKLWEILNDKLDMLRSMGQLPQAIRVAETAVDLARRAFPEEDPSYGISLEKLGQLHDQAGDKIAAKTSLIEAHDLLRKALPRDQVSVYRSGGRLAFLCDHLGQTEEAISFYKEAIAAGLQLPGLPHSELGTMLNNIALMYRKSGEQSAAEPYYLQALELYEREAGPEHADVASVLNNLAVFYTNEKRFAEAERTHLRALAIRQKIHAPDHSDIAQSKCNLAVVYHSQGDYPRAGDLYRASLESWERSPEKPPADYEIVASNYADLLRSLGKARQANQLESRARKRRRA
ncbi:MAG: tetratricopeptide repeat protein [Chthoniobacterales bacterium]